MVAIVIYGLSIAFANWMIRTVGTEIPGGTHLLPVGFGLMAPSGVYAAGVTFVARDFVQRRYGKRVALGAILVGAALSALLDLRLALASAGAFLFAEMADFAVYTPLQKKNFPVAVFGSGVVGSAVDSVLFLGLAGIPFGVAAPGLILGKLWVQALALPVAWKLRDLPIRA